MLQLLDIKVKELCTLHLLDINLPHFLHQETEAGAATILLPQPHQETEAGTATIPMPQHRLQTEDGPVITLLPQHHPETIGAKTEKVSV